MRDPRVSAGRGRRQAPDDRRCGPGRGDLRRRRQATVRLTPPIVRPAARVVVLSPRAILLQHLRTQEGWDGWITPGGAIEDGETPEAAATRELVEECGFADVELSPVVWTRRHVFRWNGSDYDQRESFYVVRVEAEHVPAPSIGADALAVEGVIGHRWWDLDELAAAGVVTAPGRLVSLVRAYLVDGPPSEPADAGA